MNTQDLTIGHLAVIVAIGNGERSGPDIRTRLKRLGYEKTESAFAMFTRRMIENGLISGDYRTERADGQTVRTKIYKLTDAGRDISVDVYGLCKSLPYRRVRVGL